ncbi:MAG: Asp-tRNA(Asn)/Glu-tRNA(Gln) amidotransferase GatCAB subunit C, partial [Candidatus Nephrothrix sp. EaCA]
WREDEVKNQLSAEEALRPAPKKDEQFFMVPKVVNHEN